MKELRNGVLMRCFSPHPQEDVSRHESEDRGTRPSSAVLHRHGHRARGQQEIQVVEVGQRVAERDLI